MTDNDWQLLTEYAAHRSEEAFATLVARHLNLVFAAALRQVRSHELAEEVSQSVFVDLARSVGRLKSDTILPAWLYHVTRRTAIDVARREFRRQRREQEAMQMAETNSDSTDWKQIEPLLDEAMETLDAKDRAAILIRYFQTQPLREVGEKLGLSEDAAQKRVSRAVEKLRHFFAQRGVTSTAAGICLTLSSYAAPTAPLGLSTSISSAVITTAIKTSAAVALTKTLAMTTLQKTLLGTVLAVAVGTSIYQSSRVSRLQRDLIALQQAHDSERSKWQHENDEQSGQLRSLTSENERLQSNANEVLKLRGEIGVLRRQERAAVEALKKVPAPIAAQAQLHNEPTNLPKDGWADAGFATPEAALQTRGWAIINGQRERFKESVVITDGARKIMDDLLKKMIASSPNPAEARRQIEEQQLSREDGLLFPMIAENRNKGYSGYKILSQSPSSADEVVLDVETQMTSGSPKTELLKMRRVGEQWKVVIDEDFIQHQMEQSHQ